MDIGERIRENFNRGFFDRAMSIQGLPEEYPAWTFKRNTWVGVAVPVREYIPFSEQFSQVRIRTEQGVWIGDREYTVLMLQCYAMDSRDQFVGMCADFVEPGPHGIFREELIGAPAKYWRKWKTLLGNVISDKSPYDILGELLVLEKTIRSGKTPRWSGIEHGTHDIETDTCSIEVKSTTQRYGYEVTINSVYQMNSADGLPLFLDFLRFEPSTIGQSINDVVIRLKAAGYDAEALEAALKKANLENGRVARQKKYKVLEWKEYPVDEHFPAITESSFKDNCIPQEVLKFTYTVDLAGVTGYTQLKSEG